MKTIIKYQFIITALLIFSSVFYYCGCYTSYTQTIDAEDVPKQKEYEFLSMKLKDGSNVNLEGKEAKYFDKYKDTARVIIFNEVNKDTLIVNDTIKVYTKSVLKLYQLLQVSKVKIEKKQFDTGKSVLLGLGIAAGIALIIVLIGLLTWKLGNYNITLSGI